MICFTVIVFAFAGDESQMGSEVQTILNALQADRNGGISPIVCFGRIQLLFTSTPTKWDTK
jgi:hypothetical protein